MELSPALDDSDLRQYRLVVCPIVAQVQAPKLSATGFQVQNRSRWSLREEQDGELAEIERRPSPAA